jgi:hypothetical protein
VVREALPEVLPVEQRRVQAVAHPRAVPEDYMVVVAEEQTMTTPPVLTERQEPKAHVDWYGELVEHIQYPRQDH